MATYGRSNVWITQAGLVCGLGRNPLQTALCARARLGLQRATEFPEAGFSAPTRRLWDLPEDCVGFERLRRLAAAALAQIDVSGRSSPIPLLLALPRAERPDDDPEAAEHFLQADLEQAGIELDPERTAVVRGGHASGARLLQHGAALIEQGEADAVLVGGVESYHHPEVLRQLHEQGRANALHERYDPIIPGEAACFLVLSGRDGASRSGAAGGPGGRSLAHLCVALTDQIPAEILAALAEERRDLQEAERAPHPHQRHRRNVAGPSGLRAGWRPARRSRAQAQAALRRMTRALGRNQRPTGHYRWQDASNDGAPDPTITMRSLLGQLREQWPGVPVEWALADLNGERDRTLQWHHAARDCLPTGLIQTNFIDEIGDLGAATAPTLVALACAYWAAGCAPARSALLAVHSSGAGRGVVMLQEAHGASS